MKPSEEEAVKLIQSWSQGNENIGHSGQPPAEKEVNEGHIRGRIKGD